MDEIGHFLSVARKAFDLIFTDVHTFPDQAATLKCVKNADDRLVVSSADCYELSILMERLVQQCMAAYRIKGNGF